MNRSIEITSILRNGMESLLKKIDSMEIKCTRIFNFDEDRVSIIMESKKIGLGFVPVARIDITEIPTNNGRITCSCLLSEKQTGQTQKIMLRLKNQSERQLECEKVYKFFRKVFSISREKPFDGGYSESSRGSHQQSSNV